MRFFVLAHLPLENSYIFCTTACQDKRFMITALWFFIQREFISISSLKAMWNADLLPVFRDVNKFLQYAFYPKEYGRNLRRYAEKRSPEKWSPGKMVPEKNGPRKNGPQEKWSPENLSQEKWSLRKMVPEKLVPGKVVIGKNGPWEKWSPEKWSPEDWSQENWSPEKWSSENWSQENWSPEKCPSNVVLLQKNARKFKRLLYFYQLIPLHTQKDVWRLLHDPTCAPNCGTLNESRKICCRVLGFHRLITSEHFTHTHTHTHHDA